MIGVDALVPPAIWNLPFSTTETLSALAEIFRVCVAGVVVVDICPVRRRVFSHVVRHGVSLVGRPRKDVGDTTTGIVVQLQVRLVGESKHKFAVASITSF